MRAEYLKPGQDFFSELEILSHIAKETWSKLENHLVEMIKSDWPMEACNASYLTSPWECFKFEVQCEEITDWEIHWYGDARMIAESLLQNLPQSEQVLLWVTSESFIGELNDWDVDVSNSHSPSPIDRMFEEEDVILNLASELLERVKEIAENEEPLHEWYSNPPCHCQTTDHAEFLTLWKELVKVEDLIDDSHFHVTVYECGKCEQPFIHVFSERIDWKNGEDPQYFARVRVTPEKLNQIYSLGNEFSWIQLNEVGVEGFYWEKNHPASEPTVEKFGEGKLLIPMHD